MKPWKLQKFAGDVIYDLRSRNLLLVVVMLLVGIVAVPVLISKSSSGNAPSPLGSAQASADSVPEGENAVVAYRPGIRNFKQRLNDLSAKDPFKQQYATPASSSSSSSDQLSTVLNGSSTTGGSTGVGGGSTGGGTGSGGGTITTKETHHLTYFWWQTDVQVGEAGTALGEQDSVKPFQFLPSADKPVLTYIGTIGGGTQAVFLVSKDVVSVGGEGTCFPSADACQLLGLNAGKGADLIYGPDGKTYHLQVLRMNRVTSSKPPNF